MLQMLCCKCLTGCCIYMHVASICFKCCRCFIRMLQVFHLDVAYVRNGFQVFSNVFASVSDALFQVCFICLLLYVVTISSGCYKSRSDCCTWDACGKRLAVRATSRAARTMSRTAHASCRGACSQACLGRVLAQLLCGHHPNASALNRTYGR